MNLHVKTVLSILSLFYSISCAEDTEIKNTIEDVKSSTYECAEQNGSHRTRPWEQD